VERDHGGNGRVRASVEGSWAKGRVVYLAQGAARQDHGLGEAARRGARRDRGRGGVSGAKPVDERELGRLLRRVESGESQGIIAYKLSRFGRRALETLQAVERIKKAGGRLVTVEDGVDSAKPAGRLLLTVLAGLAEEELEQRRAGWATARRQALERGVHVGPTPIGYRRRPDGRLEEDERVAPFIAASFGRRGQGESWGAIARFLQVNEVLPLERKGRKSVAWSRSGVLALIRSRVYRGELWDGDELVCKNAHKAIVTESQWRFAQRGGNGATHVKDGSIAAQGLLASIVYCAGCGHRLSLTGSTNGNGERSRATSAASTTAEAATAQDLRSHRHERSTPTSKACSLRRSPTPSQSSSRLMRSALASSRQPSGCGRSWTPSSPPSWRPCSAPSATGPRSNVVRTPYERRSAN
jgi:DNA invertase Pin-like site-specific DNA recombinase